MNLLVISNKQYNGDFRKYLVEAVSKSGALAAHVECHSRVVVTTGGSSASPIPFDANHPELQHLRSKFNDGRDCILLTGMNGQWSRFAMSLMRQFPSALFVFDVFDDFRYGARGRRALRWVKSDLRWRWHCDAAIVLSKGLRWRYPGAYHLDNASHVRAVQNPSRSERLVYIGSIDGRTDFQFLEVAAQTGIGIDIYGSIHESAPDAPRRLDALLAQQPSASYHGAYSNDDLSSILSTYRIGVVPYVCRSAWTRYINPDKLYHYLNAGLEVIATDIPQTRRMQRFLQVTHDLKELERAVSRATTERRASTWPADEFTWDVRWQQLAEWCARQVRQKAIS